MMFESYLFICPFCKNFYRGLVHRCPYCGYELRPAPKISDEKWELVQKIIRQSNFHDPVILGIDVAKDGDYTVEAGVVKDEQGNFRIIEISTVPKYGK